MISESNRPEPARIAALLRASVLGPAWHGPSLKEVLDGVLQEVAVRKPAASTHSIWEIVRHITAWAAVCRRTIEGEPFPQQLDPAADWPAPDGAWDDAVAELDREQTALISAVRQIGEARLEEPLAAILFT